MSLVVMHAMLLGFLRDRGAVVMALVLPIAVFLVFAAIFAGASGEQLRVTVAVADEVRSDESRRLLGALARDPALSLRPSDPLSTTEVRRLVRQGSADAGLIVRRNGRALDDLTGPGPAPLIIVTDPVRAVAARVLAGQIQEAYFAALSDVALGGVAQLLSEGFVTLEPAQDEELASGLEALRQAILAAERTGTAPVSALESLLETETTVPTVGRSHVAYYAGAVGILFLLFAAVHGALTLLEERDAGLLDRLLAGPGGMDAVVAGKFLFLLVQGIVQVTVIFILAWALYGVDLPGHLGPYAVVTFAAAGAAAGLALAITTACSSRRQAQTLANVVVLIASAVGGSMVPRFFMPPLIQQLGWLTPTAWALEAYSSVFWRGDPLARIALPVVLLLASGALGLAIARHLARRFETI
jgi:ABC-2 type transport system permease protein